LDCGLGSKAKTATCKLWMRLPLIRISETKEQMKIFVSRKVQ
jgi:hypothetical protein